MKHCAAAKQHAVNWHKVSALGLCRHEEVNLIPVIDDVMQQVMPFVREGVTVYKRMYDVPHITGDSGRIEQVREHIAEAASLTLRTCQDVLPVLNWSSSFTLTHPYFMHAGAIQLDKQRSKIHAQRVHTCGSRVLAS